MCERMMLQCPYIHYSHHQLTTTSTGKLCFQDFQEILKQMLHILLVPKCTKMYNYSVVEDLNFRTSL